jgi:ribosomal protein S12 methylthiotransferase
VLLQEAQALAQTGVEELIVIAQDTTAYGRDLKPTVNLAALLSRLDEIKDLKWIRVMYAYPSGLDENLIEVMSERPRSARTWICLCNTSAPRF